MKPNPRRKGLASQYVHHVVATAEFPDRTRMHEYQVLTIFKLNIVVLIIFSTGRAAEATAQLGGRLRTVTVHL